MISKIIPGDCIDVLKTFSDNYFDSIVTDPPYGINFMNKHWDYDVPKVEVWKECLRVLKPGGHILCACGTRTQHRMTVNIEDAGFEIRDVVAWIYGSGFPKSLNIGKAIDGLQGNKRIPIGERHRNVKPYDDGNGWNQNDTKGDFTYTQGNSEYEGWGTALKPSWEAWTLAQKPHNIIQSSSVFEKDFVSLLYNLKTQLCQLQSFVKIAEGNLKLSRKELKEGVDIVQWIAEKNTNIQEDLFVLMATLRLELGISMNLSIVLSWLNTLADLYEAMNTYITETTIGQITELKILNSMEWVSIFQNIIHAPKTNLNGVNVLVSDAESLFNVLRLKLKDIQTRFVQESASLVHIDQKINTELWTLARKPLSEKKVATNVLKYGTGGINIDGCRVGFNSDDKPSGGYGNMDIGMGKPQEHQTYRKPRQSQTWEKGSGFKNETNTIAEANPQGRFPANLIHDGSDEVVSEFPDTNGGSGSASRFFYCAKASRSERNKGLEEMEDKLIAGSNPAIAELKRGNTDFEKKDENSSGYSSVRKVKNNHPTVKPIALMKYLCKLITPVNGIVLDPYMGSGSTGIACKLENFSFVGIEKEKQYCIIARARIKFW